MRNIRLLIEYDGTNYAGWQWQKNDKTVQETLSKAIVQSVQEPVKIYGAGRTDCGRPCHRSGCQFPYPFEYSIRAFISCDKFLSPHDITIKDAADVPETFHAQYCAVSKVYQYTLFNDWIRTSLCRNFCYVCGFQLNVDKMLDAAQYLIGTHDFTSFTTKALGEKNRIRTVKGWRLRKKESMSILPLRRMDFCTIW